MRTDLDQTIHLKDYTKPEYLVDTVDLVFRLDPTQTEVISKLNVRRNSGTKPGAPFNLDGDELTLNGLKLNEKPLDEGKYEVTSQNLKILKTPKSKTFTVEIATTIDPVANTKLMGLYQSNGVFCTQCEAEGFRRITYFPDRPDILSVYSTRIEANRELAPVLLGNGNPSKKGRLANGRHFATWIDPHPKPSYLFALVAGDLGLLSDQFKTKSGRKVKLGIYVEKGKENSADYAMDALKRSMEWDEDVFSLEYDLDVFNIVAVSDFNMGAMENKGLNIFNDKYVLADPITATDTDYANIEAIIAHEYFHNWTGNRITCRDWFQLCLKEGLTVFRDQEFSSDMRDRAVKRIADVTKLKINQFPEDAGPLAHPVRPQSYREINNFYTATVYEKGAEIIRMLKIVLGDQVFAKGLKRYLKRHDGKAATIEEFLSCFEFAAKRDLSQFSLWYKQAGTPLVTVDTQFDAAKGKLTIELEQSLSPTPDQNRKKPMEIPLSLALFDPTNTSTETAPLSDQSHTIILDKRKKKFTYSGFQKQPILSLNRNFSAPVNLEHSTKKSDLGFLAKHDTDPYIRWASFQLFAQSELIKVSGALSREKPVSWSSGFIKIAGDIVCDDTIKPAYKAQLLTLPTESQLAQIIGKNINPDMLLKARQLLTGHIATTYAEELASLLQSTMEPNTFSPVAEDAGNRAIRNLVLDYGTSINCSWAMDETDKALSAQSNMTNKFAALKRLVWNQKHKAKATHALEAFYDQFSEDHLVMDKWFMVQAAAPGKQSPARVKKLMQHEKFTLSNPNRARSVLGGFAANLTGFNAENGRGYGLFADAIKQLDKMNPQTAARLLTAFRSYKSMEPLRRKQAHEALLKLSEDKNLSRDLSDILTRALA